MKQRRQQRIVFDNPLEDPALNIKLSHDSRTKKNLKHGTTTTIEFNVILDKIFSYVPIEDLKACRLTERSWHELATRQLSNRMQGILLHENTDCKKFTNVLENSCSSTKVPGLNNVHPFHSFIFYRTYPEESRWTAIIDYVQSKVWLPKKIAWEQKFFQKFGPQVFELRYCQFNSLNTETALREFREMLSSRCPNLSSLTLEFKPDLTSPSKTKAGVAAAAGGGGEGSKIETPTASPSPSPSPLVSNGCGGSSGGGTAGPNMFFPPTDESLSKTLSNLKKFKFCTDSKSWVDPEALKEFMSFMPSLEEFVYRYTAPHKQWAHLRKVDIVDIICHLVEKGKIDNMTLKVLDLDSQGTVLCGEDFQNLYAAFTSQIGVKEEFKEEEGTEQPCSSRKALDKLQRKTGHVKNIKLTKFCAQVLLKTDADWNHLCEWLCALSGTLKEVDLQVRPHFSQPLAEEQLPTEFPLVTKATLLLDNNVQMFLKRMPRVIRFCGVFEGELLPFCLPTENTSMSLLEDRNGVSFLEEQRQHSKGGSMLLRRKKSNSSLKQLLKYNSRPRTIEEHPHETGNGPSSSTPSSTPPQGPTTGSSGESQILAGSSLSSADPCCTQPKYIRILNNEGSILDIEWNKGIFKHVTSLETDIYHDQDLRSIWTHLHNNLTELVLHLKATIHEQAFTGAGVSAVTPEELAKTSKPSSSSSSTSIFGKGNKGSSVNQDGGGEKDYHDEKHLAALDDFPNMGMMKKLTTLEIYTEGQQDAFETKFSASFIIFGVSLLPNLRKLVLPPAIPPKCLAESISYLAKLRHLQHLAVCDNTFQNVLTFDVLLCALPDLEIVVRCYENDINRSLGRPWRVQRFAYPDFLPDHRSSSLDGSSLNPHLQNGPRPARRSRFFRFRLRKQCSAP